MKLYYSPGACSLAPHILLHETGLPHERIRVELASGRCEDGRNITEINPFGYVPVLELDDGTCIAESIAICRYFEALHPEPNLFGRSPTEIGIIDMYNRHLEFELFSSVGAAWVNGPIVAQLMPDRTPNEAAKAAGEAGARAFYRRLDGQLAERGYMAGERYTIADITALCIIDFATQLVDLKPDDGLTNLWRWHAEVSARPSAAA